MISSIISGEIMKNKNDSQYLSTWNFIIAGTRNSFMSLKYTVTDRICLKKMNGSSVAGIDCALYAVGKDTYNQSPWKITAGEKIA